MKDDSHEEFVTWLGLPERDAVLVQTLEKVAGYDRLSPAQLRTAVEAGFRSGYARAKENEKKRVTKLNVVKVALLSLVVITYTVSSFVALANGRIDWTFGWLDVFLTLALAATFVSSTFVSSRLRGSFVRWRYGR